MYNYLCVSRETTDDPPLDYRIAGNFHEVHIFAIFATHDQNAKIRTLKYETVKI